ncbi:MAG: Arm DNA-binding domain-containing protein, partial [Dehalococcoidia bacterium]
MKEHVRQRGKTWTFWIDAGKDSTGGRRQVTRGGFATERDAHAAARKLLVEVDDSGAYRPPTSQALGPFMEGWLESVRPTIRPSTLAMYEWAARKHIIPRLGEVEMRRLSPGQLNALYGVLLASGRRRGGGGLSPASVTKVHRT